MKKNVRFTIAAVLAISLMVAGSSCRRRHPQGQPPVQPPVDPYYNVWFDVYGHRCNTGAPMPGCNFYYNGNKIQDVQDPYFASRILEYSSNWTYTDSYGYRQSYTGYAWLSPTGILYNDFGRALNEVDTSEGRDIIAEAADIEEAVIKDAGASLAARFDLGGQNSLAEDRAIAIARTLNDWAVLGKSRSRTEQAAADFAQKIYGVKAEAALNALAEADAGKLEALNALNRQVAAYWGTTPETSQAILTTWFAEDAKELGVK
jgi:hypothetical protein